MYEYARSFDYGLNYTAQRRYVGAEVMFFSDRLLLPANVTTKRAA
jgi:DNA adenine methylase